MAKTLKVAKDKFVRFLDCAGAKGAIAEIILEEDGTVTKSNDNELIVMGRSQEINFGERIALTNIGLVSKIAKDLEGEAAAMELAEKRLTLFGKEERYEFRLADPNAMVDGRVLIESLKEERAKIDAMLNSMEEIKILAGSVKRILKAIANLSAQRLSVYADGSTLSLVAHDEATATTATVEVGQLKREFKHDFNAQLVARLLELAGDSDVTIRAGAGNPLFVEMPGKDFVYMVSYLATGV
jgi:hypothetical protein